MKEERIKFYHPRVIGLIGLSPRGVMSFPGLSPEGGEGWMIARNLGEGKLQEKIEAILRKAEEDNECHPIVMKDVGGCEEVELIVRYKESED